MLLSYSTSVTYCQVQTFNAVVWISQIKQTNCALKVYSDCANLVATDVKGNSEDEPASPPPKKKKKHKKSSESRKSSDDEPEASPSPKKKKKKKHKKSSDNSD